MREDGEISTHPNYADWPSRQVIARVAQECEDQDKTSIARISEKNIEVKNSRDGFCNVRT